MSIFSKLKEKAEGYLIGVGLKKGGKLVATLIAGKLLALLASPTVVAGQTYLAVRGLSVQIQLNPQDVENALTLAFSGGLEMARNYLKFKFPKVFGSL